MRGLIKNSSLVLIFIGLSLSGCSNKLKEDSLHTLHLSIAEKVKGLDPIYADDLYSGLQVGQVYETLLHYHYLKRPYVLEPSLAEAMPEVSADGLTYTFQLKKGVLFQDDASFKKTGGKGREMIAEDVVYSIKRLADPKLASNGWWLFDGKIAGLDAWREGASKVGSTDYSAPVEGLKALDRYTVQFKLTQRSGQFLYAFAMPFTGIVPREAVEQYGKDFINHPVGTGPYRLEEFNPSSRLIWVRNPTYRIDRYPTEGSAGDKEAGLLEDAGKLLPLSDRIVVQIFVEQQPMWLNFLAGNLDVAGIPKDNFASAVTASKELADDLKKKGIKLDKTPALEVGHLTFNLSDPLLGKNKILRQALSLAYDSKTSIELFQNGRAIPAQGPIPPGIGGYDPGFRNPYVQFNILRAKELLAKAGFPDGKGLPALEYATMADSLGRQRAEYTQKMFEAIGVTLKVNSYSWPQFQEAIKNRRPQLWEQAWLADYPDAENFLQLFYSKNVTPGPNDSNYSNSQFDRLYEKALTLPDGSERTELYRKMAGILVEDCPWIFGSHAIFYTLTQPWLKNFKANDFDHSRYKYYRLDPALKKNG